MNKPHKWAKEIKAWADGAKIEYLSLDGKWYDAPNPYWDSYEWEYRIKPTPKEPQYLYVYLTDKLDYVLDEDELPYIDTKGKAWDYIGKIKLEQDDD